MGGWGVGGASCYSVVEVEVSRWLVGRGITENRKGFTFVDEESGGTKVGRVLFVILRLLAPLAFAVAGSR